MHGAGKNTDGFRCNTGWDVELVDIKSAFLCAELPTSDKVVVCLPPIDGMKAAIELYVRLKKSLYGLRRAPKLRYAHLAPALRRRRLTETKSRNRLVNSSETEHVPVVV